MYNDNNYRRQPTHILTNVGLFKSLVSVMKKIVMPYVNIKIRRREYGATNEPYHLKSYTLVMCLNDSTRTSFYIYI